MTTPSQPSSNLGPAAQQRSSPRTAKIANSNSSPSLEQWLATRKIKSELLSLIKNELGVENPEDFTDLEDDDIQDFVTSNNLKGVHNNRFVNAYREIKYKETIDITFGQQLQIILPIVNTGYATQAKVVALPQATSFELHLNTNSHFTISISTIVAQSWSFPKLLSIEDSKKSPSCLIYLELEQDPTANNEELQKELETKASNDGLCCNCICMCSKRKGGILMLKVPLSSQTFLNLSRLLQLQKGSKHPPNSTPLPTWSIYVPPCLYSHRFVQCVDILLKTKTLLMALFAMITLVNNVDFLRDWVILQWNNFIDSWLIATIVLEMQSWWVAVIYPLTVLLNSGLANCKVLFTSCMPMFTQCGKFCQLIRNCVQPCCEQIQRFGGNCMRPCKRMYDICLPCCKQMQACGGKCMSPCIQCLKSCGISMNPTTMQKAGTPATLETVKTQLMKGWNQCQRCRCCGMNNSDTKVEDKKEK